MRMKDPAHPGEILKGLYLDTLGITITDAANMLGVSRKTLSELVNRKAGISSLMALRLAKAFPNTTPEFWLRAQNTYDLAQKKDHPALARVQVVHRPVTPVS